VLAFPPVAIHTEHIASPSLAGVAVERCLLSLATTDLTMIDVARPFGASLWFRRGDKWARGYGHLDRGNLSWWENNDASAAVRTRCASARVHALASSAQSAGLCRILSSVRVKYEGHTTSTWWCLLQGSGALGCWDLEQFELENGHDVSQLVRDRKSKRFPKCIKLVPRHRAGLFATSAGKDGVVWFAADGPMQFAAWSNHISKHMNTSTVCDSQSEDSEGTQSLSVHRLAACCGAGVGSSQVTSASNASSKACLLLSFA
jgi:hypothetical protein